MAKGVSTHGVGIGELDVEAMNEEFAFVLVGGSGMIVRRAKSSDAFDRIRFLRREAFDNYFANTFTFSEDPSTGKVVPVTKAVAWMRSPNRLTFNGVSFFPDRDNAPGPDGYLNLWNGFSVEPKQTGCYDTFLEHVYGNIAHGDEATHRWIWSWLAQLVQRPREKPGTAIILRGAMGAGKTIFGRVIGSLIADNFFLVDDARYVTGQFNAHLSQCLLLQCDEAAYASDKAAQGRLRGLITSDSQMIESKGLDPVRIANYVRVIMTSNERHVIPAGMDERRFAVFDVNSRNARDNAFFSRMMHELDNGGREKLLHDLLSYDISKVNLSEIPATSALVEQKYGSLESVEQWWFDRLFEGAITSIRDSWPECIECTELYLDYIASCERTGIRTRESQHGFGARLRMMNPAIRRRRDSIVGSAPGTYRRPYVYVLPNLAECRAAFDKVMRQSTDWGEFDDIS